MFVYQSKHNGSGSFIFSKDLPRSVRVVEQGYDYGGPTVQTRFVTAVQSTEAKGKWPVNLDKLQQGVIVIGLAYSEDGVTLGELQKALLKAAKSDRTRKRLRGKTTAGDTSQGLGWVHQWYSRSWVPPGCRVDRSENYDYCISTSRIRIVPETIEAKEKCTIARETVKKHNLI